MKKNTITTILSIIISIMFLLITFLLITGYPKLWIQPLYWLIILLGGWVMISFCLLLSAIKEE